MPFPHVSWKPIPIAVLTLFLLATITFLHASGSIPTLFADDNDTLTGLEKAYLNSLDQRKPVTHEGTAQNHDQSSNSSQNEAKTESNTVPKDDEETVVKPGGSLLITTPGGSAVSQEEEVERRKKKKHDQKVQESFISSLLMILVSEVGDKTFLIAAVMAMTHPRWVIFSAAFASLVVMSVLSAALGHVVPNLIPAIYTNYLAAFLFFAFGVRMLKEGMGMDADEIRHEMEEVQSELAEKEEASRTDDMEAGRERGVAVKEGGTSVLRRLFSPTWITAFVLTFLAEWGDRSQIATIALAAAGNVYWVTIGTILGHSACTALAVIGGRLLASRISVRTVTLTGAVLFLMFSMAYIYQAQMGLV